MSDAINLLNNVSTLDVSPLANGYTKVIINAGTDDDGNVIFYEAGTDGGAVLTIDNPWGTQQMAEDMLERIIGFQYQSYSAGGALLDPSAELGDGVNINGTYGGIFTQNTSFTSLMKAEISAPTNEEIEHEYTSAVESASDRAYSRLVKAVNTRISQNATLISLEAEARTASDEAINSQLNLQAGQIEARVTKEGGNRSTFGWKLNDSSWELYSGNGTVLKATSDGLEVTGKITASSGTIGGFDINSSYISYNNQTWGGSITGGIYIGQSGIQLGKDTTFKVDNQGNLYAKKLYVWSGTDASGKDTWKDVGTSIKDSLDYADNWGGGIGTISGSTTRSYATNGNSVYNDFLPNGTWGQANKVRYKSGTTVLEAYAFGGIIIASKMNLPNASGAKETKNVYRGTIKDFDGYTKNVLMWS